MARKIGILLDLVRNRKISLKGCEATYGASERTILRDLQELRNIGETAGFRITEREHGDICELSEFKASPPGILEGEKRVRALMAELFKAFGDPVNELAGAVGADGDETPFLHVVQPQLVDGTAVGKIYRDLEAAWRSSARVEFRYRGQVRRIEPAAAVVRSGRYYLVGRDIDKGRDGWRQFSMDVIEGSIKRVGTYTRTAPPTKYTSGDTIGFFKGDGEPQTVEVTFSEDMAPAMTSRKWQHAQQVRKNADGTVTIALIVDDVDEVIRWTLGFGDESWISNPPAAVDRCEDLIKRILARYGVRSLRT
ncbi:MAG TPA: WYL domain-containing protein [Candidatus Baltobacteraceae bacterium]